MVHAFGGMRNYFDGALPEVDPRSALPEPDTDRDDGLLLEEQCPDDAQAEEAPLMCDVLEGAEYTEDPEYAHDWTTVARDGPSILFKNTFKAEVESGYTYRSFAEEQAARLERHRAAEESELAYQNAPGWELGPRYTVDDYLGSGAYGRVHIGTDHYMHRDVAIKRIDRIFELDMIDTKRILREISIMAQLRSENVVSLYDVVCTPGSDDDSDSDCFSSFTEIHIVMELCDSDLLTYLKKESHASMLEVKVVLYELVIGLNYIHSAGIYHRDLKPANCLMMSDFSVKIADFGLARAVGEKKERSSGSGENGPKVSRCLTGHVATRWYRAPELILMADDYDGAVDIWSLGCIFAELLGMLKETRVEDRSPLFTSRSCFPSSPTADSNESWNAILSPVPVLKKFERHDQLSMIFDVIGTPKDEEIDCLDDDLQEYVRSYRKRRGEGLRSRVRVPADEPDTMELLQRMLLFSPKPRIRASEALRHVALAEVREEWRETTASSEICDIDFEKHPFVDEAVMRGYFREELTKDENALPPDEMDMQSHLGGA
jgi:mitogen-activated protein kinase 1/3